MADDDPTARTWSRLRETVGDDADRHRDDGYAVATAFADHTGVQSADGTAVFTYTVAGNVAEGVDETLGAATRTVVRYTDAGERRFLYLTAADGEESVLLLVGAVPHRQLRAVADEDVTGARTVIRRIDGTTVVALDHDDASPFLRGIA